MKESVRRDYEMGFVDERSTREFIATVFAIITVIIGAIILSPIWLICKIIDRFTNPYRIN